MDLVQFRDHPTFGFVEWSLRGVGQVVFQNNALSGLVILAALFFNSWIYGAICILGVVTATATALALKADRGMIRDGLFGYNAALTAMALGGFFLTLTWAGFLYTLFGVVVTTWFWASIAIFLKPIGMPVLTSTFVLVTWLMLIGARAFGALAPVAPADATTPEDNRARWLAAK